MTTPRQVGASCSNAPLSRRAKLPASGAALLATAALLTAFVAAFAVSPAHGASAGAGTANQTKEYVYDVQATYTLSRVAVDAATSARVSVEYRVEGMVRRKLAVTESGVSMYSYGDPAESVTANGSVTTRDERQSPPCEQTAAYTQRGWGLGVGIGKPFTVVRIAGSSGAPLPPCGADPIANESTGSDGQGNRFEVSPHGIRLETPTQPFLALHANLNAGRNGEVVVSRSLVRQQPGVTERAEVRLVFTRRADLESKPKPPAPPKPSSNRPIVVSKAKHLWGGVQSRYNVVLGFVITRGGDQFQLSKVRCTGRFADPRLLTTAGLYQAFRGGAGATVTDSSPPKPVQKLWPELALVKGWKGIVMCSITLDSIYPDACGKTLRGTVSFLVDGRAVRKSFAFPWIDRKYQRGRCF